MNVKVEEPGENNIHNNAFYAEETLLRSELQAMRDCNPLTARHWIVRHPNLDLLIVIAVPSFISVASVFFLDAQSCLLLQIKPILSYSTLFLPFLLFWSFVALNCTANIMFLGLSA